MAPISERLRPRPVAVFVILTLLIWTNRIWLAWTDPDDTVSQKLVWSTPITLFVIAAAYLLVRLLTDRTGHPSFVPVTRVFAAGTVVYWIIRMAIIVSGDHAPGFKAVHAVLGLVSAAAALWAWRAVSGEPVDTGIADGDPIATAG